MGPPTDEDLLRRDWAMWAEIWLRAAQKQERRIAASSSHEDRLPEFLLFVSAVRNVSRGAEKVLGSGHREVQAFQRESGDLSVVRDVLEHHDVYVAGLGNLQKGRGVDAPVLGLMPMVSPGDHLLVLFLRTEPGEEHLTRLEVPVERTLAAATRLFDAAAKVATLDRWRSAEGRGT